MTPAYDHEHGILRKLRQLNDRGKHRAQHRPPKPAFTGAGIVFVFKIGNTLMIPVLTTDTND
ncbi:MAG: hypothetical protein U0361_23295 [Nitrospiraceae bacterium]